MSELKVTGIFGWPIAHSLSPYMHNAAYKYLGINYVYVPFPVKPENIRTAIHSLKALNICGLNVTVPHKEAAFRYVDKADKTAKKVGAVNTIIFDGKKLNGYNTDVFGFLKSLEGKIQLKNKRVLLLGTGGAGKSIGIVLSESGAKELFVYDVSRKRAIKLAEKMKLRKATYIVHNSVELEKIVPEVDILINATPVGMKKGDGCIINPELLHKGLFVYDIVYNRETGLIRHAKNKGCRYTDGLEMLLYQGVQSFELWTKKKAPVEIMRRALLKALKQ